MVNESRTIAPPDPSRQKTTAAASVVLTTGGLLAAFGAAACCALPLFLGALGLGSAWLFRIAVVAAPHRVALLTIGVVALGLAAMLIWRQRTAPCESGGWCARPRFRRITMLALALGIVLLVSAYSYV